MSWSAHWITTIVLTTSTTYYRVTNFSERRRSTPRLRLFPFLSLSLSFSFFFFFFLLLLSFSLSRASLLEKFLQFPLRHGVMSKLHRCETEANNNNNNNNEEEGKNLSIFTFRNIIKFPSISKSRSTSILRVACLIEPTTTI